MKKKGNQNKKKNNSSKTTASASTSSKPAAKPTPSPAPTPTSPAAAADPQRAPHKPHRRQQNAPSAAAAAPPAAAPGADKPHPPPSVSPIDDDNMPDIDHTPAASAGNKASGSASASAPQPLRGDRLRALIEKDTHPRSRDGCPVVDFTKAAAAASENGDAIVEIVSDTVRNDYAVANQGGGANKGGRSRRTGAGGGGGDDDEDDGDGDGDEDGDGGDGDSDDEKPRSRQSSGGRPKNFAEMFFGQDFDEFEEDLEGSGSEGDFGFLDSGSENYGEGEDDNEGSEDENDASHSRKGKMTLEQAESQARKTKDWNYTKAIKFVKQIGQAEYTPKLLPIITQSMSNEDTAKLIYELANHSTNKFASMINSSTATKSKGKHFVSIFGSTPTALEKVAKLILIVMETESWSFAEASGNLESIFEQWGMTVEDPAFPIILRNLITPWSFEQALLFLKRISLSQDPSAWSPALETFFTKLTESWSTEKRASLADDIKTKWSWNAAISTKAYEFLHGKVPTASPPPSSTTTPSSSTASSSKKPAPPPKNSSKPAAKKPAGRKRKS